jgi:ABC-type glycerol-3-phosphate transport system substrate-binding protein
MSTKPSLLIFTISLIAMALLSCVAEITPEPRPTEEKQVTITFSFPYSQDRTLYRPIVEAFQQSHPNITIYLRPDPSGQWVWDEHNKADTFVWWPDPSLTEGDKPLILELDSLMAETSGFSTDDFYPRSLDMFHLAGTLWALPAETDMQVLYYNKDLFDEHQVAYPQIGWTWNDLLLTAQRLTTIEGDPWNYTGYYGLVSNPTWGDFVPFIYQHGGELFQFDDPRTEQAVQWYADLALVHHVIPQLKYVTNGDTYNFFQQQRAAMWIGFVGDRDGMGFHHLGAPWNFDWGVVSLPIDQTEATLYRGQGYYITAHTAHIEESWTWIQYLSHHPTGRALPSRRSTAESSDFQELAGEQIATVALHAIEHLVPRTSATDEPPETLEAYAQAVESIVNDGERLGVHRPPEIPEMFASMVESVINGEITASEAMTKLRDKGNE